MHLPLSYITMDHVDAGQWQIKLQRYVITFITFVIVHNYFSTFYKIIVVPPSHRTSSKRRTTRRAPIGWARLRVEAGQSARATVRLCCGFTLLVGDRLREVECSRGAYNTSLNNWRRYWLGTKNNHASVLGWVIMKKGVNSAVEWCFNRHKCVWGVKSLTLVNM